MDEEAHPNTSPRHSPFLIRLNPFASRKSRPVPDQRHACPEYNAGFFSLLTFSWMSSLMATGYRRSLELNDIWSVNPNRSTHKLAAQLKASFQHNSRNKVKQALLVSVWQIFKKDIIIGGLAAFLANSAQVVMPLVIKYIIVFAMRAYFAASQGISGPPIGEGVGLVLCVTALQILASIGSNHFFYRGMTVGGQLRSALISIIFDKAMTISGRAKAGGKHVQAVPSTIEPGSEEEQKHFASQLEDTKDKDKNKKAQEEEDTTGWANGRIVNLMSVDTYRIDQACGWMHMVWASPLTLVVTIILLILNLTYSALVGIGLFLLSFPIIMIGIIVMFRKRKVINKITDERITITQEVLSAIRSIKYFAWEPEYLKRLQRVRQREVSSIRWLFGTRNVINTIGNTIPIFSSMLSFITYSSTNHALDPAPVFSSLALFNQLRAPLILVPMILGMVTDALQSISRVEQFLLAEDNITEPERKTSHDFAALAEEHNTAIHIVNASFTWEQSAPPDPTEGLRLMDVSPEEMKEAKFEAKAKAMAAEKKKKELEKQRKAARKAGREPPPEPVEEDEKSPAVTPFALHDLTIEIGPRELVGVIGGVGSGKSSLLSAIAGEMRRTKGTSVVDEKRAFCSQTPWIRNATVRENITFGQDFDQAKYDRIIDACSLSHDLRMLPHGDFTEIGERGINLSGGQKHRISLARAIYFDANVILLDDPLAAVDPYVGTHLMEQAVCGLLRDKCRILATHQLHVLQRCDRIMMLDSGRIAAFDTFENLMTGNENFKRMLVTVESSIQQREKAQAQTDDDLKPQAVIEPSKVALMQEEERQVKSISWSVYLDYGRSTGSVIVPPLILFTLVLAQGSNIVTNLWLAWWSEDRFHFPTGTYIGAYVALGCSQAVFLFISTLAFSIFGTEASKRMLHRATSRLLNAPIWFFDTTPLGRITNRFSKDIDVMDNNLTESMRMAGITVVTLLGIIGLVISYYYYFAIALVLIVVIYLFSSAYYRASARELKRHEAVLRSSVFARFSEAIAGTSTLRVYGVTSTFAYQLRDAIDNMDSAYYLTFANQRWLAVRLDVIGVIFVFVTGMLVVTNKFSVSPSISGLILSYVVSITQALTFSVRQLADVENNMNATERIHYYGHELPQEAAAETRGEPLSEDWPAKGEIIFNKLQLQYRPGLPLVLQDFSLHVQPGERLGIVGRTGAGKSSIMTALFRIVEPAGGSISIDGRDITTIGLRDLRSRMSFIPQDATLLRGTIRSNLDPFRKYSDEKLVDALRQTRLIDQEQADGQGRVTLDTTVESEGANFSLGQRQLLALARALVRDSQIIVADEATSSIDFESDAEIQRTIFHGFRGKTLLCIAHRLKTIVAYDRICVVEDGRVAEIAAPLALFDAGGRFRNMCDQSHISREDIVAAQEAVKLG